MSATQLTAERIREMLDNLYIQCFEIQQSRQYLSKTVKDGLFASAMHYEFMVGEHRNNFFTQLNELPVSIRIDNRMLIQKYIRDMNNLPSVEPLDPQWTAYSQFKTEHHAEGKTLDETIDMSHELTEDLVIQRMTEDGLFLLYLSDPEDERNV